MATSTATSTEMVNAMYTNTGSLIDATMPILPLILGIMFCTIGFGLLVRSLRGAMRKITK